MLEVLVLYYSRYGAVKKMSQLIARGIEQVEGVQARIRTVAPLTDTTEQLSSNQNAKAAVASLDDLNQCHGLALGSPTRFGNMAAPLKHFLDSSGSLWLSGALNDKPACVFTSTSSLHGGQETTLLSMMLPLMHHGMVLLGLPAATPELKITQQGGTPYGVSHWAGHNNDHPISDTEKNLCLLQGKRLAQFVLNLNSKESSQ